MLHHVHGPAIGFRNQFGGQHLARGADGFDASRHPPRDTVRVTGVEVQVIQGYKNCKFIVLDKFTA